ncbi:unnamed protein product [Sympodiomycopsis kandeliae]
MPQRKTMSREELSTIIQFAPMCLVVLDRNRCLARLNKLAESTLGIDSKLCNGEPFSQWVSEGSQSVFAKALNHAAESKWSTAESGDDWARPGSSVVALHTRRTATTTPPGRPFWANVTVTACFENIPEARSAGYLHEAWYILCIAPIAALEKGKGHDRFRSRMDSSNLDSPDEERSIQLDDMSPSLDPMTPTTKLARVQTRMSKRPVMETLSEAVMHNFDFPMCALSCDGETFIRNGPMDSLLGILSSSYDSLCDNNPSAVGHDGENTEKSSGSSDSARTAAPRRPDVDASWLLSHFKLYDPSFSNSMPESEYPLFKAAVLGQRFKHLLIGAISGDGTRRVLECEGWPLYDAEGHGNHIGGMLKLEDVTRRRATLALQRQSQFNPNLSENTGPQSDIYWEHLCQEMPEICWVANGEGYLEWYNNRWYDYTGATSEQSLGAGWTSYVHDEDLPSASRTWSRALRTSTPYEIQERMRGADGTYRWMLCRAYPYRDCSGKVLKWFGTLTDIHTTLSTLAANREAKENLSDAVRVADITLWSVDIDGKFILAEGTLAGRDPFARSPSASGSTSSGSAEHLDSLGRLNPSQTAIVGQNIFDEWGPSTRASVERAMQGVAVTEEVTIRGRSYRTYFRPRRARMSAPTSFLLSQEDDEAPVIGVAGICFDITERQELERKMAETIREKSRAEAAVAAVKEASRMKSQFLAVISHEIRTPLNGVVGLSELLLDIESLPPEAQDLVHAILRSSGTLLSVINDVLDFSKVEAGRLDLVSLPFSLHVVCQDAVRDYQKLLSNKGLTLVADIQLPREGLVLGDASRLMQVLNNILSNASKFTESGTVKFSAQMSRVGDLGAKYVFTVSDTGCGVPESQRSMLFQPFRQADPSTSRKYGGSGLGLAICRNLIDLMRGEISLESQEGVGTTVSFSIPLPDAPKGESERDKRLVTTMLVQEIRASVCDMALSTGAAPVDDELPYIEPIAMIKRASADRLCLRRSSVVDTASINGTLTPLGEEAPKARILLAEDNPINSQIAVKSLLKLGYHVEHVENGVEVLRAFESNTYDLVLMDCMMPTMDGYTASRKMRASSNPLMRQIPIVALTAAAIKGRELCLAAGMDDFISKPTRRATLQAVLHKWLVEHKGCRQSVAIDTTDNINASTGRVDLAV